METRTEQAAKLLMCPLLTTPGHHGKCQGSGCMAWTWDNDGFEYMRGTPGQVPGTIMAMGKEAAAKKIAEAEAQYRAAGWEAHVHLHRMHTGMQENVVWRRPLPLGRTGSCSALTAKVAEIEVGN